MRLPIRIPRQLVTDMKAFHKPKEKSKWVTDSIEDLLNRQCYKDADWSNINNEDTVDFLMFLDVNEELVDSKQEIFLIDHNVYLRLKEAVARIVPFCATPSILSHVQPAIVRAAIRQRVILDGNLFATVFNFETSLS